MIQNTKIITLLVMTLLFLGCGDDDTNKATEESTEYVDINYTILQSSEGGSILNDSKTLKVIYSQDEYDNELAKYSSEVAPIIDFDNYRVISVNIGTRPNNATYLEIPSVYEDSKAVYVVVLTKEAGGSNCTASDVMTNPYIFIQIPRGKNVYFQDNIEYYECD